MAPAVFLRSAVVAAALLSPAAAWGSAPELFGFGARGMGLAGTLTATASGHEAVYYNPAGLAFGTRPSFALGYQRADFFLDVNGASADVAAAPATLIGIAVPIPFRGPLTERIALGFGFILPQTSVLVADIPKPGAPRFVRLGSRAQTVSIMGALGVRVLDDLSIGAGFIALSALDGAIDVAPNDAGKIGTRVRDQLVADYAPIVGALYRFGHLASVGLVYRGESAAEFTLPITANLGARFPLPIPRLDIVGTAQYDPQQIGLAVSLRPIEPLLLSVAAAHEQWSHFKNPIGYTAVPAGYPEQPAPGFSDVVSVRASGELTATLGEWRLIPRAGVAVLPSPVPEQTAFHNYLDSTRILLTAGLGARLWNLRADLGAQVHLLPERTDAKDPALVPDPRQNPGSPAIRSGGALVAWILELGVEL